MTMLPVKNIPMTSHTTVAQGNDLRRQGSTVLWPYSPFCALLIACCLLLSCSTLPLLAHAEYDHSEPAADSTVSTVPEVVRIWFTEELFRRAGMNTIVVSNAAGDQVDLGDVAIDDDDRSLLQVSLPSALPAGRYTVQWQTTSADDGHEATGEFVFSIGDAAASEIVSTTKQAPVTAQITAAQTATVAATTAPTLAPTATTGANPASGLSCFGGMAFLLPLMGIVWRRRQVDSTGAR